MSAPIVPLADLVAELRKQPTTIPCLAAADRLEEIAGDVAAVVAWADWKWTSEGEGEGLILARRYHEAIDRFRAFR